MNPRVLALALPVLCLLAVLQLQPVFVRPRPAPPLPGAGFSARREEVKQMPENPQIYFVHVGKAGGSTIARTLPLGHMIDALNCRTRMHELKQRRGQKSRQSEASCEDPVAAGNSSAFARHVVGHLHKNGDQSYGRNWRLGRWRREWLLNHTNAFVYSVRDPVDRQVSAYNYHRHEVRDEAVVAAAAAAASAAGACFPDGHEGTPRRAEFFRDCFPDGMEPLAAALTYRGAQKSRLRRRDFAARVVQGLPNRNPKKRELVSVWGSHFFFNYRRYARETLGRRPGRPVGVIRTEHLWDDLRGLDAALGGDGSSGFRGAASRVTHGSDEWRGALAYDAALSPRSRTVLCCLLRDEMAAYQDLVLRAFNLDEGQKRESMAGVLGRCRIATSEDLPELPFSWSKFYDETCLGSILPDTVYTNPAWHNGTHEHTYDQHKR